MSLIQAWSLSIFRLARFRAGSLSARKAVGLSLMLLCVMLLCTWVDGAQALSLREAAELALQNDPRLRAAEQSVAESKANIDVARAGYLPTVSVGAAAGEQRIDFKGDFPAGLPEPRRLNPLSASVSARQPLYSGGLTGAQMAASRSRLEAAQQSEAATHQMLLLAAITAYLDVVRDRDVVELSEKNVQRLQQALDDARSRFDIGTHTSTDVLLVAAQRAEGEALRKRAYASLRISTAGFVRVIGDNPENLSRVWPLPEVPGSLDQALSAAALTPSVLAANAQRASAQAQVDATRATLFPTLSIDAKASTQDDEEYGLNRYNYWAIQLQATLPIYAGGSNTARLTAARAGAMAADARAENERYAAIESITQAWADYEASTDIIAANAAAAEASLSARNAVQEELDVGSRTTFDLLNAERDLFALQISLAASQRDRIVASYRLLAACGQLDLSKVPP